MRLILVAIQIPSKTPLLLPVCDLQKGRRNTIQLPALYNNSRKGRTKISTNTNPRYHIDLLLLRAACSWPKASHAIPVAWLSLWNARESTRVTHSPNWDMHGLLRRTFWVILQTKYVCKWKKFEPDQVNCKIRRAHIPQCLGRGALC